MLLYLQCDNNTTMQTKTKKIMKTRVILQEMQRSSKFNRCNIKQAASINHMAVSEFLRYYMRKWYRTTGAQTTLLAHWAYLRYYLLTIN